MAEEDFGDEFGDYFFDEDYLYIEDEYALADELAETQVPSPGYYGTNAELAIETYEWDNYNYWGDLAYGSDAYYDIVPKQQKSKTPTKTEAPSGHKRKRGSITTTVTRGKRQKVSFEQKSVAQNAIPVYESVVFRKRLPQPVMEAPPTPEPLESFALFPDWKERFPEDAEIQWQAAMPEDMKKAAEADFEDPPEPSVDNAVEESPVTGQASSVKSKKHRASSKQDYAGVDSKVLRQILKQKLLDTGMDDGAFAAVIESMLGGGGSDDAAEQLTQALLHGDQFDQAATSSWLGEQGVNIDAMEEQDEDDTAGRRVDSGAGLSAYIGDQPIEMLNAKQSMPGSEMSDKGTGTTAAKASPSKKNRSRVLKKKA